MSGYAVHAVKVLMEQAEETGAQPTEIEIAADLWVKFVAEYYATPATRPVDSRWGLAQLALQLPWGAVVLKPRPEPAVTVQ